MVMHVCTVGWPHGPTYSICLLHRQHTKQLADVQDLRVAPCLTMGCGSDSFWRSLWWNRSPLRAVLLWVVATQSSTGACFCTNGFKSSRIYFTQSVAAGKSTWLP